MKWLITIHAALLLAACGSQKPYVTLTPKAHCYDEMAGPTTLADTPDTGPYGADPLKYGCGAPPR